jgi:hypothetical protein
MIRTGWWTGWDKFCDENGQPYERTLRTIEAYLMTARRNGLPVQFAFFAFLPEVLGGTNAFLDPEAVRKQQTLVGSVVTRFHDVPWLAWDFINEPSISQQLWTPRANNDPLELQTWNEWLNRRYPDRAALAAAWNLPASAVSGVVPVPEDIEFTLRGMYAGHNSLKTYDFYVFSQEVFAHWVHDMREVIRMPTAISPGVLVYPVVLEDSVLYVMESDSADDTNIDLRDKLTGTRVMLRLPAQHAALALVGKQAKAVVAKYGY